MIRNTAAAALAAAAISGCSWFSDGSSVDYKSAGTLPPLEVPPDLTSPARDNRYAVPDARSSTTLSGYEAERRDPAKAGSPRVGAPSVLPEVDRMKIERSGSQRWLVVQEPPEKLWPLVKDFWTQSGFLLKTEMPEAGVMETDWAENRARVSAGAIRDFFSKALDSLYSTSERDKYRTRLDRTPDGKGTEIYISHRGMQEVYTTREPLTSTPSSTAWQPRASDPELEAEFLRRLMVKLGAPDEKAKEMAAAAQSRDRAELVKANDGTELLQVHEPFDRAWRRVGLALDRVGFTVEDRDRSKGLYFVRYIDPQIDNKSADKGGGWLSRLKFWGSGDKPAPAAQYRIEVKNAAQGSEVKVFNKDGVRESSDTSGRILTLLYEQLR